MIQHNKPSIGIEESQAIAEVISSGWIAPGEKVRQFEQTFATYVGAKHAIAVSSGTAALFIALKVLGIENSAVFPTYICGAVLNTVKMAGLDPWIADINKNDFNLNYQHKVAQECFIISHTFGVPADIEGYKEYNLPIIEDCSQALGSYINGQHVGLQGDIGIFSFGPSKMITTGSGGMIVTNNDNLADKAREFLDYANHVPAFNFGMNDLQAAMGIVQLKKLPEFLRKRKIMAEKYRYICIDKGLEWQVLDSSTDNHKQRNHYRFVIIDSCVDRLNQHLADNGITAIVPIRQNELLHNMLGIDKVNYPNSEYVASHTLSLPIFPDLLIEGFEKVIEALRKF